MEESAKRAIFIGLAVFMSIIIISIVVIAISGANRAEEIAREYTGQGIKRDSAAQSLLGKDKITGEEVIYLLQSAEGEEEYNICIFNQPDFPSELSNTNINNNEQWLKKFNDYLGQYIKAEYSYQVYVDYGVKPIKVSLLYQ